MQIWNCDNTDVLLTKLQDLHCAQPLRLHGLVLSFESSSQVPERAQDFVAAVSGLQYLNLCYPYSDHKDRTFDMKCLERHKDTIKDLYIGVGSNGTGGKPLHILSNKDLLWLSVNCVNLRQLAIALPPLLLNDAFACQWDNYGIALEYLASLPRLKILRVLTWPIACRQDFVRDGDLYRDGESNAKPRMKKVYLRDLDIVATSIARVFSILRSEHQQQLSVITFGSVEAHDAVVDVAGGRHYLFSTPITYKVRRKETPSGFVTKAKRIEARLMEYEEPIAYVVDEDTDQGISLEGYSWVS